MNFPAVLATHCTNSSPVHYLDKHLAFSLIVFSFLSRFLRRKWFRRITFLFLPRPEGLFEGPFSGADFSSIPSVLTNNILVGPLVRPFVFIGVIFLFFIFFFLGGLVLEPLSLWLVFRSIPCHLDTNSPYCFHILRFPAILNLGRNRACYVRRG